MSVWCENCGGKWGVATEIVDGDALCGDCADGMRMTLEKEEHAGGCTGVHTSCVECTDDDNLNVCVTEFGAPDFCANHKEES